MPANYVLLEKITVGATAVATVAFSGIPQTGYTDLVVKASVKTTRASENDALYVYFNTDTTGANYKLRLLYGTGTAANSYNASTYNDSTIWVTGDGGTASTFGNTEFYIPNYTGSTAKSVSYDSVGENNATASHMGITASSWTGTAAINKITIGSANGANLKQYSTFYLYGVAKLGTTPAIAPYATGGDTIMTNGTYWYHAFVSSGTFTPAKGLSCDYLVVAGGGGAGGYISGGGGAGGLRSTVTATGGGGTLETALSLSSGTAYTVTIGAGGTGGTGNANGTAGSNSVFSTITSTGGGYGGYFPTSSGAGTVGGTGGSGGGAGARNSTGGARTASPVQGFAGGNTDGNNVGGGGGGAGAVGQGTGNAGNGGAGIATSITGSSVTYGGGGGAGSNAPTVSATGGSGGGGNGNTSDAGNGSNGTANTGGGGGGAGYTSGSGVGGAGGSGLVIVRYAV